jgi:hypothetical protein
VPNKKRDVLASLPQRRDGDRKYIKAVEEIRPEAALEDHLFQILICGGDEPNVNSNGPAAAKPLVFLLLQNPQELRLQIQRKLTDLIQKQRPAMRLLKPAVGSANRAGKCSALVAKQLAFRQSNGQRGAVQFDVWAAPPRALVVDGSCD